MTHHVLAGLVGLPAGVRCTTAAEMAAEEGRTMYAAEAFGRRPDAMVRLARWLNHRTYANHREANEQVRAAMHEAYASSLPAGIAGMLPDG